MSMNRRNVLIGLGAVAAGGGAVLGSGAFSQVEANRSLTVSTTADSGAYLALSPGDYSSTEAGDNAGEDVLQINVSKLNDDAVTTLEGAFNIENNTDDSTSKWIYVGANATVDGSTVDFQVTSTTPIANANDTIVGSGEAMELGAGDNVDVDIVVDATSGDPNFDNDVTIHAQDTQP